MTQESFAKEVRVTKFFMKNGGLLRIFIRIFKVLCLKSNEYPIKKYAFAKLLELLEISDKGYTFTCINKSKKQNKKWLSLLKA